jgi:hypothetical protein
MFRKTLLLLLAGLAAGSVQLSAQDAALTPEPPPAKPGDSAGPNRFWQATLSGGHYMVALDRISAVSRHKYLLDGAVIVDEVTVDSLGQALARFYFISPVTDAAPGNAVSEIAKRGRELVEKAADRTGTDVQDMVIKKYPETSHARTIEYRILSEKDLSALYASVRNAWETGRGRQFSAK